MRSLLDISDMQLNSTIAKKIGLNAALVLRKLHEELSHSPLQQDGYTWFIHSYEKWQNHFPFWSRNTIIRIFMKLEKDGWIVSMHEHNHTIHNRGKWYRINYEKIALLENETTSSFKMGTQNDRGTYPYWAEINTHNGTDAYPKWDNSSTQNDKGSYSNWAVSSPRNNQANHSNSNTQQPKMSTQYNDVINNIIQYLNNKANKNYKAQQYKTLIIERLNEGYAFEDFKYVIDLKVSQWLHNEKMNPYLRPNTLFKQPNFERYVNEKMQEEPKVQYINDIELDYTAGENAPPINWIVE